MEEKRDVCIISVIIPVYNVEEYLDTCIKSVVGQTYRQLEIILVDDGSTDESGRICDSYAEKDKRIKVIHKKNGGLVSARKEGIQHAGGEYAAYVDGDDWIEPCMLEELIRQALETGADIVTSGLVRDYGQFVVNELDNLPEGIYDLKKIENEILPVLMYTGSFYKAGMNMHICHKLFKKELVLKNQMCIDNKVVVGEDAALTYPCIMDAEKIVVMHKCFYHYCIRQNSIMGTRYRKEMPGFRCVYKIIKDKLQKYDRQQEALMHQLNYLMLYMLLLKEPQTVIRVQGRALLPFHNVGVGERIILYGGGKFGSTLHRFLTEENLCKIVLWVDRVEDKNRGIVDVSKLDRIPQDLYDKIIIAVLAGAAADEVYGTLVKRKIDERKIERINMSSEAVGKIVGALCDGMS